MIHNTSCILKQHLVTGITNEDMIIRDANEYMYDYRLHVQANACISTGMYIYRVHCNMYFVELLGSISQM